MMFTACQRLTYKNIWNPQRHISSQIIFAFGVRMLTTAILAELESCDARPLTWEVEHPCNRFYQDGRLVACQVWLGRGGVTITIYSVYGISGARWDRSKKQYFHDLMSAIQTDRIERGPLPSLLMGDFNLEIADSHCIRDSLYSKFWYDMRDRASADVQSQPTCHKGKGSQIDYLFATTDLYDLCINF